MLVADVRAGATVAAVRPLPWPGTDPQLLLLAEIDGHAGLEAVVALSPEAAYRPGAVFTMRDDQLTRMQLEGVRPGDQLLRNEDFRVEVGPGAKQRWPELRGDPFLRCLDRMGCS